MRGEAIPEQDKLLVLAETLNIEPEVLRFGIAVRQSVKRREKRWDEGVGYLERETFDAFLQLPATQRKIIREVILTLPRPMGCKMPLPRSKFCFGLIVNPTTCKRCKSVFNLIAVQVQPVHQFENF